MLVLSDSDSEWSSLERKQKTSSSEVFSKISRKPTTHKRARKKRTAIPVATPRVPPLSSNGPNPPLPPTDFNYAFKGQDNKIESLDKSKLTILFIISFFYDVVMRVNSLLLGKMVGFVQTILTQALTFRYKYSSMLMDKIFSLIFQYLFWWLQKWDG